MARRNIPLIDRLKKLNGVRRYEVVTQANVMNGPIVFTTTIPDNAATSADLTLGLAASGAPIRSKEFDTTFPSTSTVKPKVLMYIDAVKAFVQVGDSANGVSPANLAALLTQWRLTWQRPNGIARHYELIHFTNILVGQTVSDTNATTTAVRLVPGEGGPKHLLIPTGHICVDLELDTFALTCDTAVNYTGTFTPTIILVFEGFAVAKASVPEYVAAAGCMEITDKSAEERAQDSIVKQHNGTVRQLPATVNR